MHWGIGVLIFLVWLGGGGGGVIYIQNGTSHFDPFAVFRPACNAVHPRNGYVIYFQHFPSIPL